MAATRQSDSRSNRPGGGGGPTQAQRTAQANNFFRGMVSEFRRITWPTRAEWVSATLLTLILVVGVGLYTYGIDQVFGWLFGLVHR